MNHREITLAIAAASIVLAIALYPFVPQAMMPLGDSGQFMASLEMEPGTSFTKTDESVYQLEQLLLAQPDIAKVSSQTGFGLTRNSTYFSGYSMGSVNSASLIVTLEDQRQRDIWEIMDSVEAEARRTLPGLRRISNCKFKNS